ncbi:hypothetical protein B0I35DRAFT_475592 [Stachybotrys elegans]|uniref:MARVEL domain-containing protein n=1 Tax=Stachybotrys elegans TaxID=80388 RepID=A0A8K0ST55_9HYPO|nr:hypothetical protein B0I35DRAFT_475592 [Stachybotrys elegans]
MFFALAFVTTRLAQILTLIPTMGMLAWFVDWYNDRNALTPTSILILFIVSVLALAWAIFTLFSYHRSSANARFISIIDLAFVGAFIAAVYYLRGIADADCTSWERDGSWDATLGPYTVSGPGYTLVHNRSCAMLKACFAFGIMNCVFFAWTALVAFNHGDRMSAHEDRRAYHHQSRHTHRRSHSGSRHSTHSHRRVYV